MKSFGLFLAAPSLILAGIETADHLIWLVKPKISDFGKLEVSM
jgi:hypothetical protein